MSLPWFDDHGNCVCRRLDRDRYEVIVGCAASHMVVDTDTVDDAGDWLVEVPPNWLHTDEERAAAVSAARAALAAYFRTEHRSET
jgi:hypothetical protein